VTFVPPSSDRRPALLILDLQVGLCGPGPSSLAPPLAEQTSDRGVVAAAAKLQQAAFASRVPVIQTRLAFAPGYFSQSNRTPRFSRYPGERLLQLDDAAAQVVPDLRHPDAVVVTKGCVDPLVGSALPAMLFANRVTDVLIGGIATNLAVESAARHAADLGLRVCVVEDACASFTPEMHDLAIQKTLPLFAEIVSTAEAIAALGEADHALTAR